MKTIKFRNLVTIALLALFCIGQSGCTFITKPKGDSAPTFDFNATKIPDATPQYLPFDPTCNSDYTMYGHRYHVLKSAKNYHKIGIASWYGTLFHKHYTSTGEKYNLYSMTAASTTLPLPSFVKVKNLENGKEVIVKVNDRGPFRKNRILDLSYAAAKKLGYAAKGTAKVEVTSITFNPPKKNK